MPWSWKLHAVARARLRDTLRLRLRKLAGIALLAGVQGCSAPPTSPFAADPADASARAPAVRYRPVLEPYTARRPVEPGPWREQNERVTPAPRN